MKIRCSTPIEDSFEHFGQYRYRGSDDETNRFLFAESVIEVSEGADTVVVFAAALVADAGDAIEGVAATEAAGRRIFMTSDISGERMKRWPAEHSYSCPM